MSRIVPSAFRVLPTGYDESTLDEGDKSSFELTVEWRGGDRWAVIRPGSRCLTVDAEWEREPQPSSRDDAYLARCRFTVDEAKARAVAIVDQVKVSGFTFSEWNAHLGRSNEH